MFPALTKLSLLALAAPLVSAITFQAIQGAESTGRLTVKWTYTEADPALFTLELLNTIFNNAFAIENNVDKTLGELTVQIGVVPIGDGYTIEAVALDDINKVYGKSAVFRIDALGTNASVTPSSAPASSTGTASQTGSATGSATASATAAIPTLSSISRNIVTRSVQSESSTAPSTSSTGTTLPQAINGNGAGALTVGTTATMAAALLSVVAGAAVFAL